MENYLVTPNNGTAKAPSLLVRVEKSKTQEEKAIDAAKKRSRLGDFKNWVFVAHKIY